MFGEQFRSPDLLTLHVLTGMAVVLSDLGGDFAGSARLNERLLALTERAYGPTDPRVRTPLDNLAMDLRDLGDYAGAKVLAERSLAIAERTLGPKHAEAARSLHTLATIYAGLGDYAEAMRLFERATRINEEVLRPSNPESARASWFIPDLFPSPATARMTWTSLSGCSRFARKPAVSATPYGRKPEQSRRGAVQHRGLQTNATDV